MTSMAEPMVKPERLPHATLATPATQRVKSSQKSQESQESQQDYFQNSIIDSLQKPLTTQGLSGGCLIKAPGSKIKEIHGDKPIKLLTESVPTSFATLATSATQRVKNSQKSQESQESQQGRFQNSIFAPLQKRITAKVASDFVRPNQLAIQGDTYG